MESRINGHTRLFALIGSPVGHSGSPAMHNYSFARRGIDAAYLAFDVPEERTADAIEALRTLHAGGFNVTMPCKTQTARLVDRLSPAAELIGACNTVVPAVDTILISEDGAYITSVPDRNLLYHAQTPQSFSAVKLKKLLDRLSLAQLSHMTDGCSVFVACGEPVRLVRGSSENIKITYPSDLKQV